MALTVNQIVKAVRNRLDERTASFWQDADLKEWINEALRDLGRRTKHIKDTDTLTTIAGTAEYTLQNDVIEVEMVFYAPGDGRQCQLVGRSFEGMQAVWGQYRDQTGGDPAMWTIWGTPPAMKLRLYPAPSTSSKTVTVYVTRLPATIVEDNASDSTAVDFPDAWVDLVKDFVEFSALRRNRDPRWQEAMNLYNQRVDEMIVNSDYSSVPDTVIADPMVAGGVVPRWLVDGGWW